MPWPPESATGEGVEILIFCSLARTWAKLQLGHAGEGVEIVGCITQATLSISGFNWATPVKAWRYPTRHTKNMDHRRFNWATPVKAWRLRLEPRVSIAVLCFNWATPVKAWRC